MIKYIEELRSKTMKAVRSSAAVLAAIWLTIVSIPVFAGSGEGSVMSEKILNQRKKTAILAVHLAAQGLGGQCALVTDQRKWIRLIRTFIDPIRFYPDD